MNNTHIFTYLFIIFAKHIPIFYNLYFNSVLQNDEITKNCDAIEQLKTTLNRYLCLFSKEIHQSSSLNKFLPIFSNFKSDLLKNQKQKKNKKVSPLFCQNWFPNAPMVNNWESRIHFQNRLWRRFTFQRIWFENRILFWNT